MVRGQVGLDVVAQAVGALDEAAGALLRGLDQVDRGVVVLVAVAEAVVVGVDVLTAGTRIQRHVLAAVLGLQRGRQLDVAVGREAGTADVRVDRAVRAAGDRDRVLREVAVRSLHAIGLVVVDATHDAALVAGLTEREGVAGGLAVVAIGLAVGRRELRALVVLLEHEVDHARDRVGAVNGGCAVGQHFDTLDHVDRDRVGIVVDDATAVDKHQGALRTQAAQADRGGAGAAGVVDLRVDHAAGDGGQFLHQVAHGQRASGLDLLRVHDNHRVGGFQVDTANVGTGDHHRLQRLCLLGAGLVGRILVARVLGEGRAGSTDRNDSTQRKRQANCRRKFLDPKFHYDTLRIDFCHGPAPLSPEVQPDLFSDRWISDP